MPDCDQPIVARGLCSKHYRRARRQGGLVPPVRGNVRSFDHEEAALLYATGVGTHTIAKKFGVRAGSVRSALLRQGVAIRPPATRRRFDHDQARLLYDNGMPPARIAALAGVSKNTVKHALLGMGRTMRARSYEPQRVFDHAEAAAIYQVDPTVSIPILADRYGVHPLSVRKALRRQRVPVRRPTRTEDQQLRRDEGLLVNTPGITSGDGGPAEAFDAQRWDWDADVWADPTAGAALDEPDHYDERMAVLEWNWAHREGRIPELDRVSLDFHRVRPVDTTDLAAIPGAGNGLTQAMTGRHRGRVARAGAGANHGRYARKSRDKR